MTVALIQFLIIGQPLEEIITRRHGEKLHCMNEVPTIQVRRLSKY